MTENYSNEAEELVIGEGVTIGPGSCFAGGRIEICDNSTIGRNVEITVTERMVLGKHKAELENPHNHENILSGFEKALSGYPPPVCARSRAPPGWG